MVFVWMVWMLLLPMLVPASFSAENNLRENNNEWKPIKSSAGVQSFFRWVTHDKGSVYRERKGVILSPCSLNEAYLYITNAELAKTWMSNLDENYNLKTVSKSEWYTYTLFDIPWPLNKQDMVSKYNVYCDSIGKATTIVITSKDQYIPLKPGISRILNYKAVWNIRKSGEHVEITFQISANNPPKFPRYIQDPLIDHVFHSNLVRLKDQLGKL